MAENTTTYTTIIDTQVQGTEDVKELGDQGEKAEGKFKSLRTQIRETTVALQKLADQGKTGTKEFETLRKKLDDLNDAQEKVSFQAGQFDDQLSALPGPIGQVGGAIRGFNEGLNKFSLGFKLALGAVTLIIGAIAAFKESLSRTEEGQAKLNKISAAFEKIMNGIFAILEPIANLFADLIVQLLESETVMKGLSTVAGVLTGTFTALFGIVKSVAQFVGNNLVNAFQTFIKVGSAAGNVIAGIFTFDWERIKKGVSDGVDAVKGGVTNFVDNVKQTGKGIKDAVVNGVTQGFETGATAFREGSKRLTKEEREAAKKRAEEFKKEQEAALKELETYQKAATDLRKTARQKELDDNAIQFNDLLAKAKKYGLDASKLIEANRIKIAEINKKYDKEDIEKNISALDAIAKDTNNKFADRIKAYEGELAKTKELFDKGIITAQEYATKVAAIEKDITAARKEEATKRREERLVDIENEVQLDEQKYNRLIAIVNDKERVLLSVEGTSEEQKKQIREQASAERLSLQKQRYDEQIANIDAKEKELLSNTELNEAQRTQIMLAAQQDRAAVRMVEQEDNLLGIENEYNNIATSYDRKQQLINEKEAILLQDATLTENQRTAIQQAASQERQNIAMAELEAKAALQTAELDLVSQGAGLLKEIAGKNKKLQIAAVIVEQAAAIGKIAVNTGIANAKAIAASPLTFGQPFVTINTISGVLAAASAVAAGVKAIQQINSADNGTPASAGGTITQSGGGAAVAAPRVEAAVAPQIQTGGGQNPTQQIASTIAQSSGKPIKTYVLAQDVSSKQAFDRRTNNAASF